MCWIILGVSILFVFVRQSEAFNPNADDESQSVGSQLAVELVDGRQEFVIDDMILSKEQMDELFGLPTMGSGREANLEYESLYDYMVDDMALTKDQWDQLKESQQEFVVEDREYLLDDMILTKDQMDQLFIPKGIASRNGVKDLTLLWPNKTVPVWISNDFNQAQKRFILSALRLISSRSCVKFKILEPGFYESDYANVTSGPGCSSHVGYRPGEVHVSLNQKGCLDSGRIFHEFLHCLGFYHMHTTVDRDDFVTIAWDNIEPDYSINFEPYVDGLTMLGTPYDYGSVMHYASNAFSKNGKATIISKNGMAQNKMGQRTHLSEGDITRLNLLYNC